MSKTHFRNNMWFSVAKGCEKRIGDKVRKVGRSQTNRAFSMKSSDWSQHRDEIRIIGMTNRTITLLF